MKIGWLKKRLSRIARMEAEIAQLVRVVDRHREYAQTAEAEMGKYREANRGLQKGLKRLHRKLARERKENERLRDLINQIGGRNDC